MKCIRHICIFLFSIAGTHSFAQDSVSIQPREKRLHLSGYVKDLLLFSHTTAADSISFTNIIHNRFNLLWNSSRHTRFDFSLRTRLFTGDMIEDNPAFVPALNRDSGFVDLSFVPLSGNAFALHTTIDRASFRWFNPKWDIRAGRQRINWGMNLVWNPNDWFNTFSWLDFDYEERPGSDALRVQYATGNLSTAEIAIKPGKTIDQSVAAGYYRFNKKGYDIQLLGGWYQSDLAVGLGWSGNIGNWSFTGEGSWFQPSAPLFDTVGTGSLSLSIYRNVKKTLVHASVLVNSSGANRIASLVSFNSPALSPKSLSPFRYTAFVSSSFTLAPLWKLDAAAMVNPLDGTLFLFPSLTFAAKNNLDLLLISQLFFGDVGTGYLPLAQFLYVRAKWSF